MAVIYKITNLVNGKCYIGETIRKPQQRKNEHFKALKNNLHYNNKLQYAYNKYGEENFSFEVLFECPDEIRFEKEIETIEKYNSFKEGYNLTIGGDGIVIPRSGDKNPMYGRSGELSPVFKGYIYQLDKQGNLINIFGSSCEAAKYLLGYKIERGAGNSKGLCGHILQACNDWSEYSRFSKDRHRFTVYGYQWIREKDYKALKQAGYDFSSKRTSKTAYPLTILGLDKGTLDSDI